MIRVTKNLLVLLSILMAVTGCKFFEVQSENQNPNSRYSGAVRAKATQGSYGQSAAKVPQSDWSAPSF
jgi:hypothetical protein